MCFLCVESSLAVHVSCFTELAAVALDNSNFEQQGVDVRGGELNLE